MKNFFSRMLSVSVCAAAGLAGCNQSQDKVDPDFQGEPTSVAVVLKFVPNAPDGTQQTRATSDPNGTDAEAAPKSFDVFIYTSGGDYLDYKHFDASDFTPGTPASGADVWEATAPITTTTGTKNFLVGVNLPSAAVTAIREQSMAAASNVAQTIARADINALPDAGIPMFSTQAVTVNLQVDETANKVVAQVKRIVAKVTVERNETEMIQDGATGKLGQLSWTINNQNSKYYLLQGAATNYVDPNWNTYNMDDFTDATSDTEWVNVDNSPVADPKTYKALYALENTSNAKLQKELTRVTVRATFIPEKWVTADYVSGDPSNSTNTNYPDGPAVSFYTVTPSAGEGTWYFEDPTDAQTYATAKGVTVATYNGGMCYWNIFLHKASRGDVIRNDFYQCKITRIVAPGSSSSALKDPNAQAETETKIDVDVNILFWNTPVQDNYELVP